MQVHPTRPANDNEPPVQRQVAVLMRFVDRTVAELNEADERRQVALTTLVCQALRRINLLRETESFAAR